MMMETVVSKRVNNTFFIKKILIYFILDIVMYGSMIWVQILCQMAYDSYKMDMH